MMGVIVFPRGDVLEIAEGTDSPLALGARRSGPVPTWVVNLARRRCP